MLASSAQQNESATCIHISLPFWIPSHSGHHSALSRVLCAIQMFSSIVYFIHTISSVSASQVALVVKSQCRRCKRPWFDHCRDTGLIPASGRSSEGGRGNPLQSSCLENPMNRGAWWATAIGSQRVKHNWSDLACTHINRVYGAHILLELWLRGRCQHEAVGRGGGAELCVTLSAFHSMLL